MLRSVGVACAVAIGATSLVAAPTASAQPAEDSIYAAQGLADICSNPADGDICFFYVWGVLEGLDAMEDLAGSTGNGRRRLYCHPAGMTRAQAVDVVIDEIKRDPMLREPGTYSSHAILLAAIRKYPSCDAVKPGD